MFNIDFRMPPDVEHHRSESIRKGDWIIFRCPKCPEYEQRLNWRTGEMKSKGTREDVNHSSCYFPAEYWEIFGNTN